jgi:UDP-GlcNAc:undecaprenyl-phosphate/decaprenyl-phosphate GlcNAc-1-phosphate transferase
MKAVPCNGLEGMPNLIALIIGSFAVSAALVPLCKRAAFRFGCVARPRDDRWHRKVTPLFGGVAIGLTLFVGVGVSGAAPQMVVVMAGAATIFLVGLVDDVISLKPSTKLIVEFALASLLLYFGYRLNWLHSVTLDSLLTLVWVVGVTNAFNLLDNMDGLCAGIALIVATALFVEMVSRGEAGAAQAAYLAVIMGAAGGFLVYNVNPASIFMGDSGSLLLGFSFSALTLNAATAAGSQSNVLSIVAAPVLVLLIPIFDTTLVTVMRTLSGRSAAMGGRDHSSHRLVAIGLSERTAVAVLWMLAAIGGAVGLGTRFFAVSWSGLAAVLFIVGMALFAVYLARIRVYEDPESAPRGGITPLAIEFMYKRRVGEVLLDFCLVASAYYFAYRLRFEDPESFMKEFRNFTNSLPVVLASQLIAFFVMGVYRPVWRYFGMMDAVVVVKGVALGTIAVQLFYLYLYRFFSYSRTVFVIYAALLTVFVITSRASFRLIGEFVSRQRNAGRRAVIYGAGEGAAVAMRELQDSDTVKILGFIDDDPRISRMRVQGYPVLGGFSALEVLIATKSVDLVLLTTRGVDSARVAALESACAENGVELLRLHIGFENIVSFSRPDDLARKVGP